ncbi:RNA polymerase sigma factor [Tepidanaerobacter acetatoxydans Re1]|uniref:RNA polymerase sigma factor n=1 Tax=Tepidanaerobacter acetatoxydans (strain DSM 21804 / JCM 16047 / Re1) TaxID=1209989 RepID=F4LTR5_TEPAE|nr:FliA/WhiG family RNA polymerase sigma factor [Tepidanaerobacter acetatoxydans]AEE91395.1 RNA polymerase, sigma 28 subunit, FliA/WhiG [Tepidanaerobacter acetatoxydans Re1]CDI40662.1 RNA polymerase sigma factor [Tepidanaerobacter acetatoxydans Re1]
MQSENTEKLWMNYNNTKDKYVKGQLVEKYVPLIKHIVNRMNINLPPYLEYEDLISYGVFGLMQAIERYDTKKGIKFETYAYTRIKGSIIDELRKTDMIPQDIRKKIKMLQNAFSEMEQILGHSANDDDISNYLGISKKDLYKIYKEISAAYGVLSFDELIEYEDVGQASGQPDIQAEKEEVKEILGNAINQLPPQEKLVITLYYYEGLNFKEIAEVLELSQGRISQIHTKAILRLRGHLSRKKVSL